MPDRDAPHRSFEALEPAEQRRLLFWAALRITLSVVGLLALYAVLPAAGRSGARTAIELGLGLIAFAILLAWQVRQILAAEYPGLRAVEALVLAAVVLVVVFAFAYLSLSHANRAHFSEPLDHISAIYFTVTVISTVGFGDITARTDATRLIVTLQIVLDLILVVGIARTIVFAAKLGVRRRRGEL